MKPIKDMQTVLLAAASCALALALAGCGDSSPPPGKTEAAAPAPAPAPQAAPAAAAPAKAAEAPKPDPDAALAAKVKSALANDPELKMLPIDVRAANGAVTLYGTADNAKLRDKAVRAASRVDGVKSVNNNLQIVKGS